MDSVITTIRKRGGELKPAGDKLRFRWPVEAFTVAERDALIEYLRHYKRQILAILAAESTDTA